MRIHKQTEQIALPSKNLLEDSIKLCQLTVSSENGIRKALKDGKFGFLSRVKLINVFGVDDQVQAAHYKFGMDSAIVFRGSEAAPTFLHHNKSKKSEFIELKNSAGRVMVHGAMLEEWRQVSKLVHSKIQEWVRGEFGLYCFSCNLPLISYCGRTDNPQSRVFIFGHSIGGALAELQSLYSQTHLQLGARLECITFGAPRVGNKRFKREFDDIIDHCYRVVNDHDIVPGMLSSLHHVGQVRAAFVERGCSLLTLSLPVL